MLNKLNCIALLFCNLLDNFNTLIKLKSVQF